MEINKITNDYEYDEGAMESLVRESNRKSEAFVKKAKKQFVNYGGFIVGGFIIAIMTIVMATKITTTEEPNWAALSINWFILCLCSYAMYVSWSDSGMRAAMRTPEYLEATNKYKELSDRAKSERAIKYAQPFCDQYVKTELLATKEAILSEAGISMDDYINKYMPYGDKEIKAMHLPTRMEHAIIRANNVRPVDLTPPMFLRRGRVPNRRQPIGGNPEQKKMRAYAMSLLRVFGVSAFISVAIVEAIVEFNFAVIAFIGLRLIFVIFTGFRGYMFGYNNVFFDQTNHLNDKSDIIQQLLQYAEEKKNEKLRSDHTSESIETEHSAGRIEGTVVDPVGQRDCADEGGDTAAEPVPGGAGSDDGSGV